MKKIIAGVFGVFLFVGVAFAYLTDNGNHPPPTSGDYNWNASPNYPNTNITLGNTYVDPVMGSTIRRLTNIGNTANLQVNYAFNYINAGATLAFSYTGTMSAISTTTGAVVYSNIPVGTIRDSSGSGISGRADIRWHMTDGCIYFYSNNADLHENNLCTSTDTVIKTFPANLQTQGGSVNSFDATNDLFVVRYSNFHHIWERSTGTTYTGNVPPSSDEGYMGITPSGRLLYSGGNNPGGNTFKSYAINTSAKTVDTAGVAYWNLCGDHGVAVSASDGKDYTVTFDCTGTISFWRVDMTLNQAGRSAAQQRADNQVLLTPLNAADEGHFSSVYRGAYSNMVFASVESTDDNFNQAVGAWRAYKSEIVAMDVINLTVYRFAQHRSRSRSGTIDYEAQPKVSCDPEGTYILWDSNMNKSTPTSFADMYGIANPFGEAATPVYAPFTR